MNENRIALLRQTAGMRHVDVASRLGVGEATVKRWETGLTGVPDERKLALSALFEVSVPFLMGWPEEQK